jgi:single-stranded-DNA-specific exonuclease
LLSQNRDEALSLAKTLEDMNAQRQRLQNDMMQEALALVERDVNFKEQKVIVIEKEGWHKGVLGIVASRLTEQYYRPSIIISIKDGIGSASARSIEGFHLHQALSHCASVLENFGGHKQAAGLTIRQENIGRFRELVNKFADEILESKELIPLLNIDCEISLGCLTVEVVKRIEELEPFGEGNPAPLLCARRLQIKGRPQMLGKDTLKLWVEEDGVILPAVGFGMGRYREFLSAGQRIDLAFEVAIDDWNQPGGVQLKIKGLRENVA